MKGNIWVASVVVLLLFAIGFAFTLYPQPVRSFFLKHFKEGVENSGFGTDWLATYPESWFFRLFGVISFIFGIAIIAIIWRPKL